MSNIQVHFGRQCGKTYTQMKAIWAACMMDAYGTLTPRDNYHEIVSNCAWYFPGLIRYCVGYSPFPIFDMENRETTTELYRLKVINSQNLADRFYSGFFTKLCKLTTVKLLERTGVKLWPEFSKVKLESDWATLTPRIGACIIRAIDPEAI